jgi:Na+/H+ antiporter NhaC
MLNKKSSTRYEFEQAKEILKTILKNTEEDHNNFNYNYIRNKAMEFAMVLTKQDLFEFYSMQLKKTDMSSYMSESPIEVGEQQMAEPIQINDSSLFNPIALSIISIVLFLLYKKINA